MMFLTALALLAAPLLVTAQYGGGGAATTTAPAAASVTVPPDTDGRINVRQFVFLFESRLIAFEGGRGTWPLFLSAQLHSIQQHNRHVLYPKVLFTRGTVCGTLILDSQFTAASILYDGINPIPEYSQDSTIS
jgi:hypothetical protein